MMIFEKINWSNLMTHYDERKQTHETLRVYHADGKVGKFAELAVGVSNAAGNYSAREHSLGDRILRENPNAAAAIRPCNRVSLR